jgi:tripartite-type tricarboxylate transporter receptor subunit TctC
VRAWPLPDLSSEGRAGDRSLPGRLDYRQLESLAWIGLLAPNGTSPAVIGRLSEATVGAMRSSEVREALRKQGFEAVAGSPEEFLRWIRTESEKWAKVIRASGATPD